MLHLKDHLRILFSPLAFELKTLNRAAEIGPKIIIIIIIYAVFKINVKVCKSFTELVLVLNQTRIHGPHLPIHPSSGVRRKLTYADHGNGFRILSPPAET